MWEWLAALPVIWQVVIALFTLICTVVISVWGKAAIQWGKTTLGFGKNNSPRRQKRSCGDCILIIMGKQDRFDSRIVQLKNSILKDQMNLAEQKLIELKTFLLNTYRDDVVSLRKSDDTIYEQNKQIKLYQSTLMNAMQLIKDEIRRSFKENGFDELSGVDFSNYVKDKTQSLIAFGMDYVADQYPYEGMIVPWEKRTEQMKSHQHKIEDMCFELYQGAKDIKRNIERQINKLEEDFKREIDEFVNSK